MLNTDFYILTLVYKYKMKVLYKLLKFSFYFTSPPDHLATAAGALDSIAEEASLKCNSFLDKLQNIHSIMVAPN